MLRIYTFLFIVTMLSSCSLFFLPYLELNHNTYDIKIHRASLLKITVYDNNGQILNKSFDCSTQELNLTEILNPEEIDYSNIFIQIYYGFDDCKERGGNLFYIENFDKNDIEFYTPARE